ncbi:MAG: carbon-nitrogen hydrolase family protein, partial [Rhizobiales bacterium]|nr:carbon-nitrogen hydrolase family protein [Rhizobacter sp.]
MKIAALQMVSTTRVDANLATARRLVAEAAERGAELVALPEYFCLMGRGDRDKLAVAETPGEGPIQAMLAEVAREHRLWVIGGTLPIRSSDPNRVLNANCVYAPDGSLAARYDKIHLFRYDNGRERYDEGLAILPGSQPTAVQIGALPGPPTAADSLQGPRTAANSLRVGLSVCYDLRFPELYRELVFTPGQPPCDLLSVPAAFTHTTGLAHWELLLRARAVENQCYVIAAAQGGLHENGRRTFGHSMVVDPWGDVLAVLPEGEGVVMAEIDPARTASVR